MKRYLFIAGFAMVSLAASAQSGALYVGGTLGFNSGKTVTRSGSTSVENPTTSNFTFMPEVGYFFTETVSAGIAIGVSGSRMMDRDNPGPVMDRETRTNNFILGLYGRKFLPVTETFSFYGGINFGMSPGKTTVETSFDDGDPNTIVETRTTMMGAGLNAGINYRITPRVTFVGSFAVLGFTSTRSVSGDPETEVTTSNFGLNVSSYGNPFSIGMYYTIN